ncbi:PLP-dependent aminotransferase family protein [Chitinimonas sp.]|uniref:aminotransferase-like domain-containing protein n=1 Tax=Chitinimonas sp. TaxID=1934313 RepID=UPI0035B0BD88
MPIARYKSIVDQFRLAIEQGRLTPGTRLPPIRALMRQHGIALATASRVYAELEGCGLVSRECGRGTFVRDRSQRGGEGLVHQPHSSQMIDMTAFSAPVIDGCDNLLRDSLRAMAMGGDIGALLHATPHGGRMQERTILAALLQQRGLDATARQLLIVSGAQHGLSIALASLCKPGDVIAVDSLSYPGLLALARSCRLDIAALPQVAGHTDLDHLAELCRRRPVRAVYTMPTLHNPLGSVMPAADRQRLATLAQRHDFAIIEDAAYAFLADSAPAPLFCHAPEHTIYVSSLSKSVASGLRTGMLIAPTRWLDALGNAIRLSTSSTPLLTVHLACRWIEDGTVARMETAERRDARLRQDRVQQHLGHLGVLAHPTSYFAWLPLAEGLRADLVAAQLAREGILVLTAEPFTAGPLVPHALRLALGGIALPALDAALARIALAAAL